MKQSCDRSGIGPINYEVLVCFCRFVIDLFTKFRVDSRHEVVVTAGPAVPAGQGEGVGQGNHSRYNPSGYEYKVLLAADAEIKQHEVETSERTVE